MTFIPVFALWNSGNMAVALAICHPHGTASSKTGLHIQATVCYSSLRSKAVLDDVYMCIGY